MKAFVKRKLACFGDLTDEPLGSRSPQRSRILDGNQCAMHHTLINSLKATMSHINDKKSGG